jgi:cytoskeleton protein RodZ
MERDIGRALREARVARGITIEEVHERTKIRVRYLRAIEDEEWGLLPGSAYARGFIRAYATLVGLDAEALVEDFARRVPPEEDLYPSDPVLEDPLGIGRRPGFGPGALVALVAVGILGLFLVLGLTGGDEGGDGRRAQRKPSPEPEVTTTSTTQAPKPEPSEVTLRLVPTGTVWMCVVDERDREVVDGQILEADDEQGPFEGARFQVAFGNGDVEMSVNGEDATVPESASPLGFVVTPDGVDELPEEERPDCV